MKKLLLLMLLAVPAASASAVEDPARHEAYKQSVKLRRAYARQQRAAIFKSHQKPQFTPLSYQAPEWMVPGPRWNFGPSVLYVNRRAEVLFEL